MKATDFISPEVKAQEVCKTGIIKVADYVIPIYKKAVEQGIIDSFDVKIEIWNNGYSLSIKPEFDYFEVTNGQYNKDISVLKEFKADLQPSVFFNSYFKNGDAVIETKVSFGWDVIYKKQSQAGSISLNTRILKKQIDSLILPF